jgi:hypothetical protein
MLQVRAKLPESFVDKRDSVGGKMVSKVMRGSVVGRGAEPTISVGDLILDILDP